MASGTIVPGFLSASTNGRQIKVAATATAGTLLHTAVSGTEKIDMVKLEAVNTSLTAAVTLTVEWGGVTNPDDLIEIILQPQAGVIVVVEERYINNGLAIRAFADVADVVLMYGHVDTVEL